MAILSLSKTDYKVARSCRTKLYYRMNKYPSAKDGDEYMELLAEGGYMIGAIATLLFDNAILVDEPDHEKAVALTKEYFKQKNIILLEACAGYLVHPSDFFLGFYAEIPTRGLSFSLKVGSVYT